MTGARWPLVVAYLLDVLPSLPGWSGVSVFDTDPVTQAVPASYAIVARSSDDSSSGGYVRALVPSGLVSESGTVRIHVVTRTGSVDPRGMRVDGFALVDALQDHTTAHQDLGGVLGPLGTVSLTVDVTSSANTNGVAQSLLVTLSYLSFT